MLPVNSYLAQKKKMREKKLTWASRAPFVVLMTWAMAVVVVFVVVVFVVFVFVVVVFVVVVVVLFVTGGCWLSMLQALSMSSDGGC